MSTTFNGGSPVTNTNNPFNDRAGVDPQDILPSLDIEGHESDMVAQLDGYGASSPVTSDAAAQRPTNPPSLGGRGAL